jgi:hypothetical protein
MVKGADSVEDENAVYCLFIRIQISETKAEEGAFGCVG